MFDVTIAGEINLDLILYGLPAAMPVERELLASDFQATLGSSSAIVAHNLAILGARVGFVTLVGRDPLGRIALQRLEDSGVDLSQSAFRDHRSTGITVLLHHGADRHILTYPGTMSDMTVDDLNFDYLRSSRHFHLSSFFLQTSLAPGLPNLFRRLKDAGLTLSLDTNDDPSGEWSGVLDELLDLIDLLLPNEGELLRIARRETLDDALAALAGRVPWIAVKCGAQGAVVQKGRERFAAPPVMVTPVDTIGAGDSFNAGFLFAWLQGLPPEACARAGNITGALSTQAPGGTEAYRDRSRVLHFLQDHDFPVASPRAGGLAPANAGR
ncbi:MAG TPA: carbohydrate kinase family protein [Acidobacteriaceae bacterium]|nr:carbohydrate kinase family protein [Acidobacteriaceae bacterium]